MSILDRMKQRALQRGAVYTEAECLQYLNKLKETVDACTTFDKQAEIVNKFWSGMADKWWQDFQKEGNSATSPGVANFQRMEDCWYRHNFNTWWIGLNEKDEEENAVFEF